MPTPRPPPPPPVPRQAWTHAPPAQGGTRRPVPARPQDGLSLGIAIGATILPFWLFAMGHAEIDQSSPNVAGASGLYAGAILLGGLGFATPLFLEPRRVGFRAGIGAAIGVPTGLMYASYMGGAYGSDGVFLFLLGPSLMVFAMFLMVWLGGVISGSVTWFSKSPRHGADLASAICGGVTLAGTLAAVIHLTTIQEQAETARRAHQTPGLEWLSILMVLLACVWIVRRTKV